MDATSDSKDSVSLLSFSQHSGARRQTSVEHKLLESRSETKRGLGKRVGR